MPITLQSLPDGTYMYWGRHSRNYGIEGAGPAYWYSGEAAEVLRLVLKYSNKGERLKKLEGE